MKNSAVEIFEKRIKKSKKETMNSTRYFKQQNDAFSVAHPSIPNDMLN